MAVEGDLGSSTDVTMVETTDGKTLAGFVVSEEGGSSMMRTADTVGRPFEIERGKVKSKRRSRRCR